MLSQKNHSFKSCGPYRLTVPKLMDLGHFYATDRKITVRKTEQDSFCFDFIYELCYMPQLTINSLTLV